MQKKSKYIPFKVEWRLEEDEESLNIESDEEYIPGTIYWREDVILGFNSAEESEECFLITGITSTGERLQFRVNETIQEVAKKMNYGQD